MWCLFLILLSANAKSSLELQTLSLHAAQHWDKIANEFELLQPASIVYAAGGSLGLNYFTDIAPLQINNNDVVNVSFFSSTPTSSDWIAAYSPASVNIKTTVPVKWGFADADPAYLMTGAGKLQFNMTNLRSNVKFYYFKGNLSVPLYANASLVNVTFADPNQPLRPRVVATSDRNVLNLLWSSATSTAPTLKWGVESGKYNVTATATTSTLTKSAMCGGAANSTGWREQGLIHTAPLQGMAALATRRIYYIFGDAATSDFAGEHVLLVPPQPGVNVNPQQQQQLQRPTTVVLFCDLGRGSSDDTFTWNEYGRPALNTSNSIGALVAAGKVDAIFHGGDISYATGYMAVWDFFLNMISAMASGTLYLSTVGNHESDWPGTASFYTGKDSGGECGVAATRLLPQPVDTNGGGPNNSPPQNPTNQPWWSYEVGLIHFVGLSSEHNFTMGSAQWLWLEADLSSVNRSVTPWVILNLHRAMYINSNYGGPPNSDLAVMALMIANVEPLLWKHRVNLAFYGHNHVYQRQAAVYNSQVVQLSQPRSFQGNAVAWHENPQATVHVVIGNAGASFTKNAATPPPAWNELTLYEYGYIVATAYNASVLGWELVASNLGNAVLDRVVLTQELSEPWVLPTESGGGDDGAVDVSLSSSLYWLFALVVVPLLVAPAAWLWYRQRQLLRKDGLQQGLLWDEKSTPVIMTGPISGQPESESQGAAAAGGTWRWA